MPLKQITFMSRKNIETLQGMPNTAVISITNPDDSFANISLNFGPIFRIDFDDIDIDDLDKIVFNDDLAMAVWDFTETLPLSIDSLIVHCTLGISRSAGIAKAIAENYNIDFPESYSLYNKKVYRTMRQTMLKRLYPDDTGIYI